MVDQIIPMDKTQKFDLARHEGIRRVGEEFVAGSEFRFLGIRILEDGYGLRIQYRLKDHEVEVVGDEVDEVLNDAGAKADLFARWNKDARASKTVIPDPPPKVARSTRSSVKVETEAEFVDRKASPKRKPGVK